MHLGMPTLIELPDLGPCAALARELGLDFIELNMNMPQYQLGQMDVARFAAIARQQGLYYTIHLEENLNVWDFNPYVAGAYRRTVEETIALARELNVPVINMHLPWGVYFTLPGERVYLFSAYRQRYLEDTARFRDLCDKAVGSSGIRLCIENSDGFTDFQKEALDMLLQSPAFALTLDVGHDHGVGGQDGKYILGRRDRLAHMHLHDALGTKNHLPLGTGELDIQYFLSLAREQDLRVVLETKTIEGLRQSVNWIRGRRG